MSPTESEPRIEAPCRHLRNKSMFVYTDGQTPDADHCSGICWCVQTMKHYGPDDRRVEREDCSESGRSCYEPL